MSQRMLNAILEGCNHDNPHLLQYCDLSLEIPMNSQVVHSRQGSQINRFYLSSDSFRFSLTDELIQMGRLRSKQKIIGIELNRKEPNLHWIYEQMRSITTKDGRIYVSSLFFDDKWTWYLEKCCSRVLSNCKDVFSGETTLDELNLKSERSF
jgi:hypothetical protein